jgi:MFS family permease
VFYKSWLAEAEFAAQGYDRSAIAWATAIESACFLAGSLPSGWLMNTVGLRWTIVAGGALYASGCLLASYASAFWLLYIVYGAVLGTGCALSHTAAIVAVQHYFSTKRGTATGLTVAGSGVGALVLSPVYDAVIARAGWRVALRSIGFVSGVVLMVAAIAFRPLELMPDDEEELHSDAEDEAAAAAVTTTAQAGESNSSSDSSSSNGGSSTSAGPDRARTSAGVSAAAHVGEPPPPAGATALKRVGSAARAAPRATAWQLLRVRPFAVYCGFVVLYAFSWFAILTHFVPFASEAGSSSTDAALLVSWQGAANTAGRIGLGVVSDVLASRKVQLLQGTVGIVALATILLVPLGQFAGFRVVYMLVSGSMGGSIVSLQPQITAELVGMPNLPVAQGLFNSLQAPLTLASPPFAGWLRQATGGYTYVWAVVAAFTLASWFVALGLPHGLVPEATCARALAACTGRRSHTLPHGADGGGVELAGAREMDDYGTGLGGERSRLGDSAHVGVADVTAVLPDEGVAAPESVTRGAPAPA